VYACQLEEEEDDDREDQEEEDPMMRRAREVRGQRMGSLYFSLSALPPAVLFFFFT
jgi:hypothetical protein